MKNVLNAQGREKLFYFTAATTEKEKAAILEHFHNLLNSKDEKRCRAVLNDLANITEEDFIRPIVVPEGIFQQVSDKVQKLIRKCKKYNSSFTFEIIGEEIVSRRTLDGVKHFKMFHVAIDGEVKNRGWRVIAAIHHEECGNVIYQLDYSHDIPVKYFTAVGTCQHCNTNRYRKETFLLWNGSEYKQVGKTCLEDYTGIPLASALAVKECVKSFYIDLNDDSCWAYSKPVYETDRFLQVVSDLVAKHGYRGSSYDFSTADEAAQCYFEVSADISDYVKSALEWAQKLEANNTYANNIRTICSNDWVDTRNLGFLASVIPSYQKHLESLQAANDSAFVGSINDKIKIAVSDYKCVTSYATMYGFMHIYSFKDESGNVYIWKTSKELGGKIESLQGTIKAHDVYNGVKQTEMTRCKVA